MKFIDIEFSAPREKVIEILSNSDEVNSKVRFDERYGKPLMKVKDNGKRVKITCEMIGGATKDNGFLVGTYFSGKAVERAGKTRIKGIIVTAPIYHAVLLALVVVFIIRCIQLGGFSIVPILLTVFDLFMFKNEFKKQGRIERYIKRAKNRTEAK